MKYFTLGILLCTSLFSLAQKPDLVTPGNRTELLKMANRWNLEFRSDSVKALELQRTGKAVIVQLDDDKSVVALVKFDQNGRPVYYATDNANAAATVSTNKVWSGVTGGYGLTGGGITIGEWDGGGVRLTHVELNNRVSQIDSPSSLSDHSTHVAGTMIATGINANAKGMAYQADIDAYSFFNDDSEMSSFAANGGILSNHSYGRITGWRLMNSGTWRWYGDTVVSGVEDWAFGFYTFGARSWDLIANAAPYYLIVKSAGNDRNDEPPASVTSHEVFDDILGSWVTSTASRPKDGGVDGYDCTSSQSNAKNILTVGAVADIPLGYTQPSDVVMSSFSGWGPTDDGRIKPDIVANGISLMSSGSLNNTDYYSSSGTSMSAPNATGSLALLQEMYDDSNGVYMRAATLKALVIHTADESGTSPGPDYSFGWGLLNTKSAADLIADSSALTIQEDSLINGDTNVYAFNSNGLLPIKVTIVWNDPAGTVPAISLNPTTLMLVQDLDIRLIDSIGTTYMPWALNPAMPSAAATTGDNIRDNVEQIFLAAPAMGSYTVRVTNKGTLQGGGQAYSIIITGATPQAPATLPVAAFSFSPSSVCENEPVQFTDMSLNNPTTYSWLFPGGTPSTSTMQNPVVSYSLAGTYSATLIVSNADGTDSLTQSNIITVLAAPNVSTQPFADVCEGAAAVPLTGGLPAGGVWSGPGVTGGNTFNPAMAGVGTHNLIYSVSNSSCTTSDTQSISVNPIPVVTHPNSPAICMSGSAFPLFGGIPAGGTYSGPGVVSGTFFDPGIAGLGIHTLTYTVTDSNMCTGSTTFTVTVIIGTSVNLPPLNDVCVDATPFVLTGGTPAGGTYFGNGVDTSNNMFNPAVAGVGTHVITYVNIGGFCASTDTSSITVNPLPSVTVAPFGDICVSAAPMVLTGGTPVGGAYSGTGVVGGNMFDPAITGTGTFMITYTYADANGCANMDSAAINVLNSIPVTVTDLTGICANDAPFNLTIGSPAGGTYSGTGVTGGTTFNPAMAGAGVHTVVYTYTQSGCTTVDSGTISVNNPPAVSLAPFADVCVSGGQVPLSGGMPIGGTYSGPGVSGTMFDPAITGLGTFMITYTYSDSVCSNSATAPVNVVDGMAEITNISDQYCITEGPVSLIGNPVFGTFSGPGMNGNVFVPANAGVGTHTITYTTFGNCPDSASYQVTVLPQPVIGNIQGASIANQTLTYGYQVAVQNGAQYNWQVVGGTIVSNNNNQITVQWGGFITGTVTAILFDQNGCTDTTSMTVDLWPLGVDLPNKPSSVSVYPNPFNNLLNIVGATGTNAEVKVQLFNATGQLMMSETNEFSGKYEWQIDVSNFSAGVYFYQISEKNGFVQSGRMVKK